MILILGLVSVFGYSMIYSGLVDMQGGETKVSTLEAFLGPKGAPKATTPKGAAGGRRFTAAPPPRVGGHTTRT